MKRPRQQPRQSSRHVSANRNGVMVVVALVCLIVISSIVGSMIKNAVFTRRELLTERDRRQAELLMHAGASRAAQRLAADLNFRGDTWELPAAAITNNGNARVATEITPSPANQGWNVRVVAEYPLGRDFPIRRSQTFRITPSLTP